MVEFPVVILPPRKARLQDDRQFRLRMPIATVPSLPLSGKGKPSAQKRRVRARGLSCSGGNGNFAALCGPRDSAIVQGLARRVE